MGTASGKIGKHFVALSAAPRRGKCRDTKKTEFSELIGQAPQTMAMMDSFLQSDPLIIRVNSREQFEQCQELLEELRQNIKTKGFNNVRDERLVTTIYDDFRKPHSGQTLQDEYVTWLTTSRVTEEERARQGYATPEKCEEFILEAIDAEIKRLK